jgi:phytoene dehydrogenase-like protein
MTHHDTGNLDVAIVGGGLAGLTAAALLADNGHRVAVFERSEMLGGRAVSHIEQGFHLNLGPHAWYVGSPATKILTGLGVPLEGRVPRPRGAFALAGGRLHTLPIGFMSLLTTDVLGVHGKLEAARVLASLSRLDTTAVDRVPLADWLRDHISDDGARGIVEMFVRVASYAHAPHLLSAGAGLAFLRAVLKDNVRYLHGGWQSIVDALRMRARSAGARIVTGAPISQVVYDSAVRGVRLADGDVVTAPHVVVAATPAVVRDLVPDAPASAASAWRQMPAKAACLDLALARLPKPTNILAFGVDRPLYYSVHSATARLAPEGGAVIHVAKYLEPDGAHDVKADERELENVMDTLQPGWRGEVIVRRFLPSMTVTHAIPLAAAGGLEGRAPVEVREVPGLFLAGDWVGREGTLASAAVASAAQAAGLIEERLQRRVAVA